MIMQPFQPSQAVLLHIRYVMESICEWMSFTDVTIVTGTERLRAHRAILASHSSYLRQLMTANVRDAGVEEDPTIVVRDVSSAHLRLMMQGGNSIEIWDVGNFSVHFWEIS